jgi:stress-induced morphogen
MKMETEGSKLMWDKTMKKKKKKKKKEEEEEEKKKKKTQWNAGCEKMFYINIVFIRFSGRGYIGRMCHQK